MTTETERDPSELPVAIECRWFTAYRHGGRVEFDDYVNVCTWADGSTSEYHTIPREWNAIAIETHKRKLDASNARMAAEHAAGCVGDTPVSLSAIKEREVAA